MGNLILTRRRKMPKHPVSPMGNQDGSVILIALMLLVVMTVIGLSASRTSVTESYILRNTAIYNQNIDLLQSAAEELAEDVLIKIPDPAAPYLSPSSPIKAPYIISMNDWMSGSSVYGGEIANNIWYDTSSGSSSRVLLGTGTTVTDTYDASVHWQGSTTFPQWIAPDCATSLKLINDIRGNPNNTLRVCLVGWEPVTGGSLKGSKASPKRGYIMAEYVSPDYGMMRLEVGIQRSF